MAFDPQVGDMLRYDYLWSHEHKKGHVDGLKEGRACFVVVATKPQDDGSRFIALAGVSHRPPSPEDRAIDIPMKVGKHLGLDDERSWIKTAEINEIVCQGNRIPVGLQPVRQSTNQFIHGKLPRVMREELVARVNEHSRNQTLKRVVREDELPQRPTPPKQKTQEEKAPKVRKPERPTLTLPPKPQQADIRKPLSPEERRKQSRDKPKRTR